MKNLAIVRYKKPDVKSKAAGKKGHYANYELYANHKRSLRVVKEYPSVWELKKGAVV